MPFAFLLLVLSVPLAGGHLGRLAGLRLARVPAVVAALGLQVLMSSVIPTAPFAVLLGLHALSYGLAGWALWANRRVPGLLLVAFGGGLNAAVITLNQGTLPADPGALAEAGFPVDPQVYKNSGVVADPLLPWLGDITATPAWLPFRNVISIGDLTVLLGAAVLLHVVCRTRLWVLAVHVRRARTPSPSAARRVAP